MNQKSSYTLLLVASVIIVVIAQVFCDDNQTSFSSSEATSGTNQYENDANTNNGIVTLGGENNATTKNANETQTDPEESSLSDQCFLRKTLDRIRAYFKKLYKRES